MFFAPLVAPPPPPPAQVVFVQQPAPVITPTVQPSLPSPDLLKPVTVSADYQWGACQAIARVAYALDWSFTGNCTQYNRVQPLPLKFGTPAPAADWLNALAHNLPAGTQVRVDPVAHSIQVTP